MKVKDIVVKNRIRKDLGDLTTLKESIQNHGLLYPIIVDQNSHLIAGERRLASIKELGWEEVEVIVKNISYKESLDLELLENTTRKEFTNDELVKGIKKRQQAYSKNIFVKIALFFQRLWGNFTNK